MTHSVQYRKGSDGTADTGEFRSSNIWATCPIDAIQAGTVDGFFFDDDFVTWDDYTSSSAAAQISGIHRYYVIAADGVTINSVADSDNGAIQVAANDAANDDSALILGQEAGLFRFGTTDDVWFEASFQKASVTNDALGFALGFYTASVASPHAAIMVDTTGVIDTDADFIGFHNDPDDGDVIEPVYQEASATAQQVGKGTTNALGSGTDIAVAAATTQKLGLRFIGSHSHGGDQGRIEYFNNGVLTAWYDIESTAAWPDTNHLCLAWATKSVLTAASTMNLNWWRVATVHN